MSPTYWLNPDNGISYPIVMQTPQHQVDTLAALQTLPITAPGTTLLPVLAGVADIKRSSTSAVVSQYNIQPVVQVYATAQGRDLGALAGDVQQLLDATATAVPKGSSVVLLGQVKTMNSAFNGLLFGLLAAIVLIYLLVGGQLPVMVGSVRHRLRPPRRASRHRLDPVLDADDAARCLP